MTKSNNNISAFLYLVMLFIFVGGCKKKEEELPADEKTYGNIVLQFKHFVGDSALVYSSKEYINVLGQPYSVSKLKYYVSNIKLVKPAGGKTEVSGYYLLEHSNTSTSNIYIGSVATGTYVGVEFNIGVDSTTTVSGNHTGALSHTNGMFWNSTDGFIFLKMEGSSVESPTGNFQFDIGGYSAPVNNFKKIIPPFNGKTIEVQKEHTSYVNFKTDLAEILSNPYSINFYYTYNILAPNGDSQKIAKNYMDMFSVMSVIN